MPVSIRPGQMALMRTPLPAELIGRRLHQADDAGLARAVGRAARARAQARDRRRADDRAALARRHDARRVLHREERADQVDLQHLGPVLRRLLVQRHQAAADAGVGEAHIERTELAITVSIACDRWLPRMSPGPAPVPCRRRGLGGRLFDCWRAIQHYDVRTFRANRMALARPMPLAAPLMRAVLPSRIGT